MGSHGIRYGIAADQKYLSGENAGKYDTLFINATACLQTPGSLSSFLAGTLQNMKPFVIDPLTHAFQHDHETLLVKKGKTKKLGIKKTLVQLAEEFKAPATKILKKRSIVPADFSSGVLKRNFCRQVVDFQLNLFQKHAEKSGIEKYFKYAKLNSKIVPAGVVAPYFFMEKELFDSWKEVNLTFVREAHKILGKRRHPLFAEVAISRDIVLDKTLRKSLISDYVDSPADMLLLWIDNWQEHALDDVSLEAYMKLLEGLGEKKPIWILYGSYFSVLLMKIFRSWKIKGISHGPEYGEDRSVLPVGGGVPTAKYYYPPLHHRLRFEDAYRMGEAAGLFKSAAAFYKGVCDCAVCHSVIGDDDPSEKFGEYGETKEIEFKRGSEVIVRNYPIPKSRALSVRHYIDCKEKEYCREVTKEKVISELAESYALYNRFDPGLARHLDSWIKALKSISN